MAALVGFLTVLLYQILSTSGQGGWAGHARTSEVTLFRGDAPVIQLREANWTTNIHGSSYAWAANLYASWCGSCQRFAPTWKNVGNDLKEWSEVVRIAAFACSQPDNTERCRNMEVHKYPSVRFFHPNSPTNYHGILYEGPETGESLRMGIIDFLENIAHYPDEWPKLQPLTSLGDPDLVRLIRNDDKKVVVVFEDDGLESWDEARYIGREVILDMSGFRQIVARRMMKTQATNLGVTTFPSLYRVNKDGSLTKLAEEKNRKEFVKLLRQKYLGLGASEAVTESAEPDATYEPLVPDGVHTSDLESGLYYSFYHEVGLKNIISGNDLSVLRTQVEMFTQLLPVSHHVYKWLREVNSWLLKLEGELTGAEWVSKLDQLQSKDAYIPKRVIWTGCKGSKDFLRGYPCSLWTMFHTMLTSAYNNFQTTDFKPKDVLLSMKAFIPIYFACNDCSNNFKREARNMETEVSSDREAVLWLWSTHNRVNNRLHDDPTEDQRSPKVQFPVPDACSECYTSTAEPISWNEDAVLQYVNYFYGAENVIEDSLPSKYIAPVPTSNPNDVQDNGFSPRLVMNAFWLLLATVCAVVLPHHV